MKTYIDPYIPALKYNWLTSFYDPLLHWTLREATFKRQLISHAQIQPGNHILDLGCGTGTLTLMIKKAYPQAEIVGLDGDPKVLQLARQKALQEPSPVVFDEGLAQHLPYPDHSFDRVVSSLFFHHLTHESKVDVMGEVLRVLRPGGEFHIADWGPPQNGLMRGAFLLVRLLDGFKTTADNVSGLLPQLLTEVGFRAVQQRFQINTLMGTIVLYQARKSRHKSDCGGY